MKIVSIVGARPNFVKIAPISWALRRREHVDHRIIHTGQHFDTSLSSSFFDTLDIPEPNLNLDVGSSSHGVQTGTIMCKLEPVLNEIRPDWVVVVGDVNSTVAATLVASKLGLRTAHVEAGLRSFDRTMPEEINRLVTDSISDLLFVTEQAALDNLSREGVPDEKVHFVGNVMIDTLIKILPKAREVAAWSEYGVDPGKYLVVTLHRPSNVDSYDSLKGLMDALVKISHDSPLIFPMHPRTRNKLKEFGILEDVQSHRGLIIAEPVDYLSFLSLVTGATGVITDSGGIQEETTYLGIPCITLRPNTERPVTIELGTNELIEPTGRSLMEAFNRLSAGTWKKGVIPKFWDGRTAERIADVLLG